VTSPTRETLAEHHRERLHRSAISDESIVARGYRTAYTKAALGDLGFKSYQRSAPALIIPVTDIDGRVVNYQARPDEPRIDPERGRLVKYETPGGSVAQILAVPPMCRERIGRTINPIWITEGVFKADALATAGATAIGLLGVDMWHDDDAWGRVPLEDRQTVIAFDSDARSNPKVHSASARLATFLRQRGAAVQFLELPQDNGKVGVDDYLVGDGGRTLEDLWELVVDELAPLPADPPPAAPPAPPALVLLNLVDRLLRRYVWFPTEHHSRTLALWCLHTWAFEAAPATPYMALLSAEKRSGKTRVLEVLELVCRDPLRAASISAAGVFQAVEKWTPSLLIDEVDAYFTAKSEQAEALRGILNAGNRRGSYVVRGTQEGEPRRFAAFCPKALSGINANWPDTVVDRSIVLEMQRKKAGQGVEDFFPSEIELMTAELKTDLGHWAQDAGAALADWRRVGRIPGLTDRQQEAWDPLLAIADHAGGPWPRVAVEAAKALAKAAARIADESYGHQLLVALAAMFDEDHTVLASQDLCIALNANEELPFGGMRRGDGIDPRGLARLLRPYDIRPKDVRVVDGIRKGYRVEDFDDAWARYAPQSNSPENSDIRDNRDIAPTEPDSRRGEVADEAGIRDTSATQLWPHERDVADVADVADSNGRVAVRNIELREPVCRYPRHRGQDWAMPGGEEWVCGVCHPPGERLRSLGLVYRNGDGSS
jgi:hypothetical protein